MSEDKQVRSKLQALANHVEKQLPFGWGFVVLAFPFGADGRMHYVSNAKRGDVVRSMYEFITRTKQQWGEHVADDQSEDTQLSRALQRIAELEEQLHKK
jgi:hypothetical protein